MGLLYPTMGPAETERYIHLMAEASKKESEYRKIKDYRAYYRGDHPVFLTERQEEFLGELLTEAEHKPTFNLCATVVDVLRERLVIEGFTGKNGGEQVAETVWGWWQRALMDEYQITVARRALRDGRTYLILDWDAEKEQPVWVPNRAYDGVTGVTYYRDQNTDKPMMAFKYWSQFNPMGEVYEQKYRTVYLPGSIQRYREAVTGNSAFGWVLEDEQPWTDTMTAGGNPLGLAVIEFRNPGGVSEIEGIIGLQNGLNKSLLDLLGAADTGGFGMYTISYPGPPEVGPADDEETTSDDLPIAPGRAVELFNGATMGQLAPTDLSGILDVISTITGMVAGVSRTPQYYLRPFGGSDVPSGEALKQLESALVSRAQERFIMFGNAWVEAIKMAARLWNAMGKTPALATDVDLETNWADPQIKNELYNTQVATAEQTLGIPQEVLWERRLGYSPDDVKQFKAMKAREQASQLTATLMAMGNGRFNNNPNGNGAARPTGGGPAGNAADGQQPGTAGGNGAPAD